MDTLWFFNGIDIGSPANDALSNPVAAVPSLHAGYAIGVGVGIILFTRAWWARALGVVYPLAVVLTIIVTGNHFVLDAIAGILVMGLGFALAEQGRRWKRDGRFGRSLVHLPRDAGWSSQVARRAHNPEVAGSNPAPATGKGPGNGAFSASPEAN